MAPSSGWFCTLLDTSREVYFRYNLAPERRFVYVSPSVEAMTGHTPDEFYANSDVCLGLIAREDRHQLRFALRGRRARHLTLRVMRHGVALPIEVRTVAVVRSRRVVAIEGVATLAIARPAGAGERRMGERRAMEPVQQRLTALMAEVHDLLHQVLPPPGAAHVAPEAPRTLTCGDLALDEDRLIVTEAGQEVAVTAREVMVLRYFLQRPGRVVERAQLLTDVWNWRYTGDDRTVDVHVSRLRRKLPSLRGRLVAIRNVGYRLDLELEGERKPRTA